MPSLFGGYKKTPSYFSMRGISFQHSYDQLGAIFHVVLGINVAGMGLHSAFTDIQHFRDPRSLN